MTWWAWTLIWSGLVVALLAVLALFSWLLLRKFMTLMDDLGDLADRTALLDAPDAQRAPVPIAVLSDPRDIRERESNRKRHRSERRRARHEARIARATAITRLDPRAKAALVATLRERWSTQRISG